MLKQRCPTRPDAVAIAPRWLVGVFGSLTRPDIPLDRTLRSTVDEWRSTATAIMLPPVKFDNNRLFIGYVKNQVRFRIRLFKFHVLEQVKKQELL